MSEPIRWGILGASNFARNFMGPAIHAARGNQVAAVASRSAEKIAPFADFAPGLRSHHSYEALLDDPEIDAVYIPLPNHLHVSWSEKALAAGKHVLCEKPVAMNVAELDSLIAARDASGKLAAEAFMIVHHPQWQQARALLAENAVGKLRHVDAVFSFNNAHAPENIRNQPNMGGGGMRDIGVYTFGSVRYATGQEPVTLAPVVLDREQDFDVFGQIVGAFEGFSYHALVSIRLAKRQSVVFHGDKGVLTVRTPFNAGVFDQAELLLETREGEVTTFRYPGVNQYVLQVEAFSESVRTGAPYAWTLEQSRGTIAMIDTVLA